MRHLVRHYNMFINSTLYALVCVAFVFCGWEYVKRKATLYNLLCDHLAVVWPSCSYVTILQLCDHLAIMWPSCNYVTILQLCDMILQLCDSAMLRMIDPGTADVGGTGIKHYPSTDTLHCSTFLIDLLKETVQHASLIR